MRALTLAPLLLLALTACTGQGEGEIDPDRPERACADGVDNDQDGLIDCADDDCDGDAVCDGSSAEVCDDGTDNDGDGLTDCDDSDCASECVEICDDGADNDQDGLADCEDDDCADEAPCWWPESISHQGDFELAGGEVDCGWVTIDVECREAYSTVLTESTASDCPNCDLTFEGSLNWSSKECSEKYTKKDLPTSVTFGMIFLNQDRWALFSKNSDGEWNEVSKMDRKAGGFEFVNVTPVREVVDQCGSDVQDLGDLTTTLSFQEQ